MRINHNIAALNTYRQLGSAQAGQMKSMEKLSSGLRINRAGDDAAGLAISEKMRGQIRGLDQASANAQDGISLIQTAEGALNETHSILQRMRELGVQGSSESLTTDDRNAISEEVTALKAEINNIAEGTKFNTKQLLNGGLAAKVNASTFDKSTTLTATNGIANIEVTGARVKDAGGEDNAKYQINYDDSAKTMTVERYNYAGNTLEASQTINIDMSAAGAFDTKDVDFSSLGIKVTVNANLADGIGGTNGTYAAANAFELTGSDMKISIGANGEEISFGIDAMDTDGLGITNSTVDNYTNAKSFVEAMDTAITKVSTQRSKLGAVQNRLEHTINNLSTSSENLTAAESRIRDVDMAKEMMEQTKNSILAQASQAMLAQANQQPQGVLQLLR
ncbi:flagellin [Bacillus kwashiorkori]|uniref:flagellin N-terminal helical domain-containing protein n=2 Tax=Bacillales TaxID=1385 RepID=UPI000785DA6F|nr:flagellin [Bacillus kwashiorkori]